MKITQLIAHEIYNSSGIPTIECDLFLEDGAYVSASVPSGLSHGSFEAQDVRDGDKRLMGKGVLRAIEHIENSISPLLIGHEPDVLVMDMQLLELDGTNNKSNIGANAILAVSMAVARAQALVHELELYELLAHFCDLDSVMLPFPMFTMINGGMHGNSPLPIQDIMIMPIGTQSFRESMELAVAISYKLEQLLGKYGKSIATSNVGGFIPSYTHEREALNLLMEAITTCGVETQAEVVFALDIAASYIYNPETSLYTWKGAQKNSDELIELYIDLAKDYPLYSLEDGLSELDIEGWKKLSGMLGETLQLVGDSLFATNAHRIMYGLEENLANAVTIKPNQVGTVTQTLQSIKLCKDNNMSVLISHRSGGETNDTFIVDLAVGTSAGQIKAGGCRRGECMAKYNQLLMLEDSLITSVMSS